jgi:GDP-L-fucose synthase
MKIFIAGHNGMVGSAIVRRYLARIHAGEDIELILASRKELDLVSQKAVTEFLELHRPDEVIIAAAKVGGIYANDTYPADFIYQNLMIQSNLIHGAFSIGVKKLLFLGSSCIYPRLASQPMAEIDLLSGHLEPTNEPYAIAKIAGIKLCESYNRQYGLDYRSIMPTNLYGPGDNFHSENSHVIPALIRKFHEGKVTNSPAVTLWGSGNPLREFLYVDDMATASVFLMDVSNDIYLANTEKMCSQINVGSDFEISIRELAELVSDVVGYEGHVLFDTNKPDGPPRKLLDSSRLNKMGWRPTIEIKDGLARSYAWYMDSLT